MPTPRTSRLLLWLGDDGLFLAVTCGSLIDLLSQCRASEGPLLQLWLSDLVVCQEEWAMLLVEVVGFEERPPLLVICRVCRVDGLALFEDIWGQRLLEAVALGTDVICGVSVDCHKPTPVQVLELLADLLFHCLFR